MPTPRTIFLSLALGAVCATTLAACGGDDDGTIPAESASVMLAALDEAEAAVEANECETIASAASEVSDEAAGLPSETDPEVRQAVIAGAEQLFRLARDPDKCETATGSEGQQKQKEPDTDETTTAPPTTTTEETTTTTEETTTTTEEEPPPEQPDNEGPPLGQGNQGGEPPPSQQQQPPPESGGTGPGGGD
jgi:peptidoglycan DL-endopeptidase CwlO